MSTKIDSLQLEIQSNSTNAATGIDNLAKALKKLKKNSDINDAVTSLNDLRKSLHAFVNMPTNASKIESLANSLAKLKKVGKIDLGTSLGSVKNAMESLGAINVDGVAPQIQRIAGALAPLNNVKGSGINAMMNGLLKLDSVVDSLDSSTIDRFVAKMQELNEKLTPVSAKLVAIGNAFKVASKDALTASGGFSVFGGKVNTTTLNLQSMISVVQSAISVLQPIIRLLQYTIGEAIEWDGIAARFGRGFGDQAEEVYAWVQRLNKEMGINTQQFMQYSSVFSTMLQGFGVGLEDSSKMALGYTELVYDIWAGYNDVYKSFGDAAEAVKSAIAGEVEPIRRAGFTVVESQLEMTAANHGLEISLEKATEAQKSYLRYLTLVDQAHAQNLVGTYARELNTAEGMMRTFSQQLKSLAQTFGSVFLPILIKVMPWLQAFVDLLNDAILAVAKFFGIEIQKVDFGGSSSGLENIGAGADSATESLEGATAAAKELKNATVGIDELNVISPPDASSGGGSGGGAGSGGDGFGDLDIGSLWDESIFDQIQFEVEEVKDKLKSALSGITSLISGFALAVGTILVVSGANIPLGLGLMAVGAIGLVASVAENWNSMSEQLAKTLTTVTSVVAGFLLAIGAFLAFSGVNVGLGVALMAAGAVSLATAVTINWKFLEGDLKNTLSILTGIVSGGLLAMGALFAFTGVDVPLGIALMAAGAVGLATTVALNWDSMPTKLKKVVADLTTIVSNAAIVVGAMLAFSGANVPLGMAFMAAGAAGLVAAQQLNWEATNGKVGRALDTLTQAVSSAALGIGAVLAFSGVNLPVGIALMSAGAVGLISGANINWNSLTDKMASVLKEIGIAAGTALLALGLILCLSGVASPLGIALIAAGATSLATGVALNWGAITDKVKETVNEIGAEWDRLWDASFGGIKKMFDGVIGWFTDLWDELVGHSIVPDTIDGIVACFTGLPGKVLGVVANFVTNVINKFNDFGTKLVSKVSAGWDAVKNWWENGKANLSTYTPTIGNITAKLSTAWTDAHNWWNKTKANLSTYTPNIGNITAKLSTAWTDAHNWWNKTKANLSTYTPSIGNITAKLSTAWTDAHNWWNKTKAKLSTYTPPIGSVKNVLSAAWTDAHNWWNNTKARLSTYTPTIGNIRAAANEKWAEVVTWWNNSKAKLSYTPSIGNIKSIVNEKWAEVVNWWNNSKAKLVYTPTIGKILTQIQDAWKEAKQWWSSNVKLSIPALSFKVVYKTTGLTKIQQSVVEALDLAGWPTLRFAENGGVFDAGSLIWAGEAGPELVANAGGGRTGVMNVEQMQTAVYEGVYAAVTAAMRANGGNSGGQAVNVYLDGRQITSSVEQRQHERGANLMGNQVYSYG